LAMIDGIEAQIAPIDKAFACVRAAPGRVQGADGALRDRAAGRGHDPC
jgi:hypothetical protein